MPTKSKSGVSVKPAAPAAAQRPLRKDAEVNRLRILETAGQVFAERGLDVSMEDIAAAAGVGVGTLYRRFRDKQELIDALFGQRLALIADLAAASLDIDDPWESIETFMHRALSMQIADRGLADLLRGRAAGQKNVEQARVAIDPLVDRLVARAQSSGQLRSDVTGPDLAIIGMTLSLLAERLPLSEPRLWERYLAIALDGLKTARTDPSPLPAAAPSPRILHPLMISQRSPG